jgi:hypothetical protein
MKQHYVSGTAPNGNPVRILFGWEMGRGLWISVYDPSLGEGPFVEYYPRTPDDCQRLFDKYQIDTTTWEEIQ